MDRLGIFDIADRHTELDAGNDPPLQIHGIVAQEDFRLHPVMVWYK